MCPDSSGAAAGAPDPAGGPAPDVATGDRPGAGRWPLVVRLLLVAAAGAAVAAASYLLAVRTGTGQRWEDLVFEGRKATALRFRRVLVAVAHRGTPVVGVVGTVVLAALAARRRRWWMAAGVLVAVGGTAVTATVAKRGLPRPVLDIPEWAGLHNRWPSGHVALATALALLAVTVSPPRHRTPVTAVAAVVLAGQALAIVGSGWHGPADVVGGLGWGLAWVAAVVSVVVAARGRGRPVEPGGPGVVGPGPDPWRVAALSVVAVAAVLLVARNRPTDPRHDFWAYYPAAGGVVALAAVTVVWWSALLGADRPDPPRAR